MVKNAIELVTHGTDQISIANLNASFATDSCPSTCANGISTCPILCPLQCSCCCCCCPCESREVPACQLLSSLAKQQLWRRAFYIFNLAKQATCEKCDEMFARMFF